MADPAPADKQPDPGGPVAGIDRYRELAKWIITVFAAVGALLVAGSQLSSLGALDLQDDLVRILAAVASLALALVAAMYVIWKAIGVLRPIETSLDELGSDPIAQKLNQQPASLPFHATTVEGVGDEYRMAMGNPFLSAEKRTLWNAELGTFLDRIAFLKITDRFDSAWRGMTIAVAVGAAAILVFAYAANPPKPETSVTASALPPTPTEVTVSLTSEGKDSLGPVLGPECVSQTQISALAIGGDESSPTLVTVPGGSCKIARFSLPAELGHAGSMQAAPTPAQG
jgi:hypothetical protein